MPHRYMLGRFVTAVALGAMVGFVGVGCGGDDNNNNVQQDAGQRDVNVQDDVAAQQDGQKDVAVQDDAANTAGQVIVVRGTPQLTGTAMDTQIGWIKSPSVLAGWDPVDDPDVPTTVLDTRSGPFGCIAKYYKKGQVKDGGAVSDFLPSTANAGDITVSGYTKGAYFVINPATGGPQITDAGTPQTEPIADTINCKREEILDENDAGVLPDAATGRYEYTCDISGPHPTHSTRYVTEFLAAADTLSMNATGAGYEIGAFSTTTLPVAPFIRVLPNGTLWNITGVAAAYGTDAGVPIGYACGDTDAGVDTAQCSSALGIQIRWGDVDTPATFTKPSPPWRHERGTIQCAAVGAKNAYSIPWDIWNAAFPAGANPRTIVTFVLHFTPEMKHNMATRLGAGGAQLGVTHAP